MSFINKLKNKLFPDEKEILYYENMSSNKKEAKENRFVNNPTATDRLPIHYKPQSFSNTQEISDSLKKGNVVKIGDATKLCDEYYKKIMEYSTSVPNGHVQ